MRLPGFTAEAGLLDTRNFSTRLAIDHDSGRTRGVVPAWFCHGNYCCQDLDGGLYCIYHGRVVQ
jgi:hypothetical protein